MEFTTELLEAMRSDKVHDVTVALDGEPHLIQASDSHGFTLLHYAAQDQARGCVEALIDRGARLDAKDKWGNGPLWVAVMNYRGHDEVITTLLRRGADPDAANNYGRSPRQIAQLIANYDVAKFFLNDN